MEKKQGQNRNPADREGWAEGDDFAAEMNGLLLDIQECVILLLVEMQVADPGCSTLRRIQEKIRRGRLRVERYRQRDGATRAAGRENNPLPAEICKGRETILLVDDERTIIDVTRDMLETFGYHVLASQSGQDAIRICQDQAGRIDLVILDMILPDMNGEEIFALIKAIRPDMPVILASGFSLNDQIGRIMARGCDAFLQKPFGLSQLSGKVREVLDRNRETP
jgi:CheY-like chemotaxis protein